MEGYTLGLKGAGVGQRSHITFTFDATPANYLLWLYTMTDAGVSGLTKCEPVAFASKDVEDGANTDSKLIIHGKCVATGANVSFIIPAYKKNMVGTVLTERGEVVTEASGQTILNAWKIAAGYGAAEYQFTSGRVKQTL
jgi:hypothetical protein